VHVAAPTVTINRGELATASWFAGSNLPPNVGPYVLPIMMRSAAAGAAPDQGP
jgi:hypothetical protein